MVRRLAHEERGVALVLALIAMLVLGSLTAALAVGVSVNQRTTARSAQSNKAFALAEEGIAYAEGRLYSAAASGEAVSVPSTTLSQDGGSITYVGSLASSQWTLTGTGTYQSVSRVVTVKIGQPAPIVTYDTTPWNYFYVEGGPSCMSIGGSTSTVNIPIYTHGSLCLSGNAVFTGSDLEVGGDLTLSGSNAGIGKSTQPISKLNVVGACTPAPCNGSVAPIFVTSPGVGHTLSPVVTKPVVDFPSSRLASLMTARARMQSSSGTESTSSRSSP
jgi:Tfp pilus assembly protein PilX